MHETVFYWLGKGDTLMTAAGLRLERHLAWGDLIEAIAWLVIIFSIDLILRMQGRGTTAGAVMSIAKTAKLFAYAVLFALTVYWASLSHWLFVWDTFVWVAGFAVIELNAHEWRKQLVDERERTAVPTNRKSAGAT